ncbi:GL15915 [Drosophila persimilis]|uniref:GL15915 n=1 Tax=Drosophila persimilis TaxID=7234 RepID=B4H142_DROPE|nr:GL15915 [Drosophila persimilis]
MPVAIKSERETCLPKDLYLHPCPALCQTLLGGNQQAPSYSEIRGSRLEAPQKEHQHPAEHLICQIEVSTRRSR